ncbi:unnamed protein product [Arctia plantaginis]|uniref:Uncharacterized protein n=1 Tax=Arctia plantaginis TaxID=874455 RepID=A0A8S0Z8C0_ARCPL|nr:unnamed protein product [Arctia plantaginis]CAB3257047.1 unnamed protein product [Arctia plantaginis]
MRARFFREAARTTSSPAACWSTAKPRLQSASDSRYITHLHSENSLSPDTGTYCIDYVTSQLTVTAQGTSEDPREVYQRVLTPRTVGKSGRVIKRVGSSCGVDVGVEGARRLRTHRADGYISR